MDELRLAVRRLSKRPASTVASIATLAGSIGAAVVMWTVLHALLIRPLPVSDPETLVTVAYTRGPDVLDGFLYNEFREMRDNTPFAAIGGWGDGQAVVRDAAGERTSTVHFVSAGFFETIGVRLPQGRAFAAADDQPGAPLVAVISDRYRQRAFPDAASAPGAIIHVAGKPVTIAGVAPRGFRGLDLASAPDLFMPMGVIEDVLPVINYLQQARAKQMSPTSWIGIVGRMPAGGSAHAVQAQLAALPAFAPNRMRQPLLEPIDASALPRRDRATVTRFTRLLAGTVALLLATGCATVALLLLVRTEDRRIEFATCLALGATRARLARGIAIEGALLASAGAVLAIPAALWLVTLLESFSLPGGVALRDLVLDFRVQGLGLAIAGALAATVLIAVIAGIAGLSMGIAGALRAAHTSGRGRPRARAALIVVQLATAVVLVAGTGLFIRSLTAAVRVNSSRDASTIVTARFPLQLHGYTPDRSRAFHDAIAARAASTGTIAASALVADSFSMSGGLTINGTPRRFRGSAAFTILHGPYFDAIGLRIVDGRAFDARDSDGGPPAAIVSASLARIVDGGEGAVGRRVRMPFSSPGQPPAEATIVGVAEDLITSVRQLQPLVVYLPAAQQPRFAANTLVARAAGDGRAAIRDIMAASRGLDPAVTPRIATLKDALYDQMRPQQLGATVLGALGVIAVLLTVLGLYVIAESTAAQRTRELGIRAALGATHADLRALLVRDNLRLAAVGAALGLAVVYASAGMVQGFLFGIESFDPWTLTIVPSAIVTIAVLVGLGPAMRASRTDLARALRD